MITVIITEEGPVAIKADGALKEYEVLCVVHGATTREEAFAAVKNQVPEKINGLEYDGCRFEKFSKESMEISATYVESEDDDELGTDPSGSSSNNQVSFDLSAGSERVMRGKEKPVTSKGAPEAGGLIGWNGKHGSAADFAGVEVVSGVMRISYQKRWSPAQLNAAYIRVLAEAFGSVNSKPFNGWKAGEALFIGASYSGNASGSKKVTVTYNFGIRINEGKKVEVNGVKVDHEKEGWEYVWAIAETKAEKGKLPAVVVSGVYIEKLYSKVDFGRLKI